MTTPTPPESRSQFSEREIELAAPAVRALREAYDIREAINVVALIVKTVVEDEPRRALYRWSRR
jgi:hypothetical protein